MAYDKLLEKIFTATTGVWTLVVLALIAWLRSRPSLVEKLNERRRDAASERAGDFDRLRSEVTRLSERLETLEKKVKECEDDREEWRKRALVAEAELIKQEAYFQGSGNARQDAQLIVSAERKDGDKK